MTNGIAYCLRICSMKTWLSCHDICRECPALIRWPFFPWLSCPRRGRVVSLHPYPVILWSLLSCYTISLFPGGAEWWVYTPILLLSDHCCLVRLSLYSQEGQGGDWWVYIPILLFSDHCCLVRLSLYFQVGQSGESAPLPCYSLIIAVLLDYLFIPRCGWVVSLYPYRVILCSLLSCYTISLFPGGAGWWVCTPILLFSDHCCHVTLSHYLQVGQGGVPTPLPCHSLLSLRHWAGRPGLSALQVKQRRTKA